MMSLDRLIIRIRAVLDGETEGFEVRALASEYAAHTETVRERMRQCAALIRAGNDNAAFQAAETAPALLDLAAKLAFDGADRWREYCRENRLPVPAKTEDDVVEAVNELYSKEIGESHPLYRDYRTAIRERDELRALGVLRSITRVNANDRNALAEHARLVAKIRREMLGRLAEALRDEREADVFETLEAMERAGIPPAPDDPSWREATRRRESREHADVQTEISALTQAILERHAEHRFEALPALLGRLRSLEKQYALPPGDSAETLARIETETAGYAELADRALRERERARELLDRLRETEATPVDAPANAATRRKEIRALTAWLRDLRDTTLTPELEAAAARAKQRLRVRRRASYRKIFLTGAAVLVLGGAGLAGTTLFTMETARRLRDERFAAALESVTSSEAHLPAVAFLEGEARESPAADKAANRAKLALLRDRVARAEERRERVRAGLDAVTGDLADTRLPLATLRTRLAAIAPELEALPPEYREEERPAYAVAKRLLAERELAEPTVELEELLASSRARFLAGGDRFRTAMTALEEALKLTSEPDSETALRARSTLERARALRDGKQATDRAYARLDDARSFETLFAALQEIAESGAEPRERRAAETVLARREDLAALPHALLNPEAAAMNRALRDPALRTNFIPEELTALEAAAAEELNLAARFAGVHVATRTTYVVDGAKVVSTIYLKNPPSVETYALNGGEERRVTADVLKPDGLPERRIHVYRKFEGRPASGELIEGVAPSKEAALLASVAKAYDPERRRFLESPLVLLDRVLISDAGPLVKAWVHKTVLNIVSDRPDAWGVTFSPEFQREAETLRKRLTVDLAPTDWMRASQSPERQKALAPQYAEKHRPYAPAARARMEFARGVLTGGVAYAGRTDANGYAVPSDDKAKPGDRICGLNTQGSPAVLGVANAEGRPVLTVDAAPFSPLVRFATSPADRRQPDDIPDAQEFFLKRP